MEVEIGKRYKHFKGNEYVVIDIVFDSSSIGDDLKKIVIYQAQYGKNLKWARSYEDFTSKVDKEKYPDVTQEYRFGRID